MRKLAITLAIILVLGVIAALILPSVIDVNSYHDRIQAQMQSKLGRPVSLGRLHLSILPLYFGAESPVIGEDRNFRTGKPFAEASEVDVSAALWPLIHGDVQISSLELKQPRIELVRNAQGMWNFSSLGGPSQPTTPQQTPGKPSTPSSQPPANSGSSQAFSLQDLKITDGTVALTDYQKKQPRAIYDHIDLRIMGYEPGHAFDLIAAAHLPGQGAQLIKLQGTAGPVDQAQSVNTPFDGSLEFNEVSLSGLQKFLNSASLENTDAIISGKTNLKSQSGKFDSDGSLKLDQPRVHGHDLGYAISADYKVSDDLNSDRLNIEKGNLKLGSTPLSITGMMNMQPTPSQIDLHINASNVSIDEVAQLAADFGTAFSPGMKISGQLNADLHAQGAASQPAMNGTLQCRNLVMSGKDLRDPVKVPIVDLALTPNDVRSNDFSASTGGTTVTGRFTLSQYTSNSPLVDAQLQTGRADLGEFLSIAKAYGVSAAEGVSGSGIISLNLHATGPLKNSGAMTFSGNGLLQNAQIKSPSLTAPLKIGNANLTFSKNSAVLQNVTLALGSTSANGSLTMSNFENPQVQFTLSADKLIASEWQKIFAASPTQNAKSENQFWDFVPRAEAATAQPSLINRMTGSGKVSIGTLLYDDLTLNNVQSTVSLDHGIIRMDPLTAGVAQGTQSGTIVIDARNNPITYSINTKVDKVDANQLLSSVSNLKKTLYGLLAANGNASFNSGGDNIARTLNGNFNLNLSNGKLANVDVLYQLANIGKFLSTGKNISQHPFTNVAKMTGNFAVHNGVAQTNDLQAIIDGATMSGNGAVDLANNSVNMRVTTVLTKAMTDSIGGVNGVGGYMTTALANRNGELVMPVLVSGSMSNPRIVPDFETIARMKLQNLLPTSGKPGDLSSGILGALLGKNNQQQANQPQEQPQPQNQQQPQGQPQATPTPGNNGQTDNQQQPQKKQNWGDVLNQLLNKKKQQQQQQPQPTPTPTPQ